MKCMITHYMPIILSFTGLFTHELSDQDMDDIKNVLALDDLKRLLRQLNIAYADILEEEAAKENLDKKNEAKLALQRWREKAGSEATRQKILDALKTCKLKDKALVLEKKWRNHHAAPRNTESARIYDAT